MTEKQNIYRELLVESNVDVKRIEAENKDRFSLEYCYTNPAIKIATLFREAFRYELIHNAQLGSVNRSTYTYYVSSAMLNTARLLHFYLEFEVSGKRDAVITAFNQNNRHIPLLYCEWEYDQESVFGDGKEIKKLASSASSAETGAGLLFTYSDKGTYPSYLFRVAEEWRKSVLEDEFLILTTVLSSSKRGERWLTQIATAVIDKKTIELWDDLAI